ncbi:MAG: class II glutamine amidotransferase, partial [Planctomycetota bacterium]
MLDPIHHECGVAAVYRIGGDGENRGEGVAGQPAGQNGTGQSSSAEQIAAEEAEESVVRWIPDMLIDLQNRGQLAAGLTRYNPTARQIIDTHKDVGSVSDVFKLTHPDPAKFRAIIDEYRGPAAIGHVRYATCGTDDPSYAQPFERHDGRKSEWFAFAFNGNIANYRELADDLVSKGYHLVRETDTELLMHHIGYALNNCAPGDFPAVFAHIAEVVDGAYTLAFLNANGDMILARDPHGFRPLEYGVKDGVFAAASESLALTNRGIEEVHSLEPG